VLDNLVTGRRDNLARHAGEVEIIEVDIRDAEACRRACAGTALVFHQAALGSVPRSLADPAASIEVNVGGSANVLAAAREAGVRRVVYASSSSVYGDSPRIPKREGEEGRPISPYAASKVMGEELAEVFGRCYGLETVGLRYFNVYGPRQRPDGPYAAVVPRFFQALAAGEPPVIFGDGEQSRDFTFVADAVAANLRAASAPAASCGAAYNVAYGRRTTITELAQRVRAVMGGGPEPRYEPARPGDVPHSLADLDRARAALGYEPAWDLDRGLAATARCFTAQARL
jgi:nucleoside-diphosphate-sugar epimerase